MEWQQLVAIALTGGFTLAAALGGAALSDRRSERREQVSRDAAARDELRAVLAEMLVDARNLIDIEWVLIPMFASFSNDDLLEFSTTDSGIDLRDRKARLQRSLTASRLLVSPRTALGRSLLKVGGLYDELTEKAHGPVTGNSKTSAEKKEGVIEGFKHIVAFREAVTEAEVEAIRELARLGAGASDRPAPRWWKAPRRWFQRGD